MFYEIRLCSCVRLVDKTDYYLACGDALECGSHFTYTSRFKCKLEAWSSVMGLLQPNRQVKRLSSFRHNRGARFQVTFDVTKMESLFQLNDVWTTEATQLLTYRMTIKMKSRNYTKNSKWKKIVSRSQGLYRRLDDRNDICYCWCNKI